MQPSPEYPSPDHSQLPDHSQTSGLQNAPQNSAQDSHLQEEIAHVQKIEKEMDEIQRQREKQNKQPAAESDIRQRSPFYKFLVMLGFQFTSKKKKGEKPTQEEEEKAQRRGLVLLIAVSVIAFMVLGTGVWVKKSSNQDQDPSRVTQTQKTTPPQQVHKKVELQNTEEVAYAIAGQEKDAEGRTVEHMLRIRKNRVDGSLQIETNQVVDGVLSENWQPMDADKMAKLRPAREGVAQSQSQMIYAYGGESATMDGARAVHVVAVDLRREKPRVFERSYVEQKPVSNWSQTLAFQPDEPLSGKLAKADAVSDSHLKNSDTALYSHAGKHMDSDGREVEYVLYTYWDGWGGATQPKTLVNKRIDGKLSPSWTYLEDTPIPEQVESVDLNKIAEKDPSKIYAYAGKRKAKQGGEVDYYVVIDRYQPENEPKVQQVVTDSKGTSTLSDPLPVQEAKTSAAAPFISSSTSEKPQQTKVRRSVEVTSNETEKKAEDQEEDKDKKEDDEKDKEEEDEDSKIQTEHFPVASRDATNSDSEASSGDSNTGGAAGAGGVGVSSTSGASGNSTASNSGSSSAGTTGSGYGGSSGTGSVGNGYGGGYTTTRSSNGGGTSWSGSDLGENGGGGIGKGPSRGGSSSGNGSNSGSSSNSGNTSGGNNGNGGSGSFGENGSGSNSSGSGSGSSGGGSSSSGGGSGGGAGAGSSGGSSQSGGTVLDNISNSGAVEIFSNLYHVIRRFSLVIILIGAVLGGILFVLDKKNMAIGVFAAAIIIGGAPTVIEMLYSSLR